MKLNMVAPNVRKGFIRERNEAITYLELSESWTQKALAQDIKAGAKQFTECLDLVEKHSIGHTVVIKTNTQEDGLMAVSYLSAISSSELLGESEFWKDTLATVMEEPDDSQLMWLDKVVGPDEFEGDEAEEKVCGMLDMDVDMCATLMRIPVLRVVSTLRYTLIPIHRNRWYRLYISRQSWSD